MKCTTCKYFYEDKECELITELWNICQHENVNMFFFCSKHTSLSDTGREKTCIADVLEKV